MPYYTFRRKNGKQFTKEMTNSDREQFLKDNPNITQVFVPIATLDAVRIGVQKPPADFQKHIIGNMQKRIPKNTIGKNSRFKVPKEL